MCEIVVPYYRDYFLLKGVVPVVPMVLYSKALRFFGTTLKNRYGTYGTTES